MEKWSKHISKTIKIQFIRLKNVDLVVDELKLKKNLNQSNNQNK